MTLFYDFLTKNHIIHSEIEIMIDDPQEKEAYITVKLDGKVVVDWRSEYSRLKADNHWRPGEPWSFGFGGIAAHDGTLTYHSARLRLLEKIAE